MLNVNRWINNFFFSLFFFPSVLSRIPFIFLFLIVFFIFSPVVAQRNVLRIDGSVKEEKEKLEGVSITVYMDQKFFAKNVTESNGKFRFQLEYDSDYILEFSKPGYVTKKVVVNTVGVSAEDQDFGHEYGGWDLSLFRLSEGIDVSQFDKPFVKIAFNPELNKFEHDVEYTASIKQEFEQALKDFEKKSKEETKRKKEEAKIAEKEKALAAAKLKEEEAARRKEELETSARKKMEEEAEKKAKARVEEEERKVAKQAVAEGGEDKKTSDAGSLANDETEYRKIIELADRAFNNKEFEESKKMYSQAQKLKPKDNYPAKKIKEIILLQNSAVLQANKARRDTGEYKTKEEFLQALARLYPQGVTEEVYMEGNVKITRRIVVAENTGAEYKMAEHSWGGKFWFKNGVPINESIWNTETRLKK